VRANLALFPLNRLVQWPEWIGGRFSLMRIDLTQESSPKVF